VLQVIFASEILDSGFHSTTRLLQSHAQETRPQGRRCCSICGLVDKFLTYHHHASLRVKTENATFAAAAAAAIVRSYEDSPKCPGRQLVHGDNADGRTKKSSRRLFAIDKRQFMTGRSLDAVD
jgi:hypothetical protein